MSDKLEQEVQEALERYQTNAELVLSDAINRAYETGLGDAVEEIERMQWDRDRLSQAFFAAIKRPMGVVPSGYEEEYKEACNKMSGRLILRRKR